MPSTDPTATARLTRLRELAATTDEGGTQTIETLLRQQGGDCPRFAGIAEHAGQRVIVAADSERELAEHLSLLVTADPPHSITALVDLDSGEHRTASTRATVRFAPGMSETAPPSAEELARATIANIEAVTPSVSPSDHDRLTSAVEDVLSLLGRVDPAAAERLEST